MLDYIKCSRDKNIDDPDPNKIYNRRKEINNKRQSVENDTAVETKRINFPDGGLGVSLERMPMLTRAEMNLHIVKSGKRIAYKNHHSVPTGLRKATAFLKDEYLKDIQFSSDQSCFYFSAKCSHSFRKNGPPHDIKITPNILSGEVVCATCSCVARKVGYCNHALAIKFKLCKFPAELLMTCAKKMIKPQLLPVLRSCKNGIERDRGGSNITPDPVMDVEVKKIKLDNTTSKPSVKSLFYEARVNTNHDFIDEQRLKEDLAAMNANMGFVQMVTKVGSNLGW